MLGEQAKTIQEPKLLPSLPKNQIATETPSTPVTSEISFDNATRNTSLPIHDYYRQYIPYYQFYLHSSMIYSDISPLTHTVIHHTPITFLHSTLNSSLLTNTSIPTKRRNINQSNSTLKNYPKVAILASIPTLI